VAKEISDFSGAIEPSGQSFIYIRVLNPFSQVNGRILSMAGQITAKSLTTLDNKKNHKNPCTKYDTCSASHLSMLLACIFSNRAAKYRML
jgi:hypothetical protein